jgi:hypothetical protein
MSNGAAVWRARLRPASDVSADAGAGPASCGHAGGVLRDDRWVRPDRCVVCANGLSHAPIDAQTRGARRCGQGRVVRQVHAGHARGERSERSLDRAEHARTIAFRSVRVISRRSAQAAGETLQRIRGWRCARRFPAVEAEQLLGDVAGASCTRLLLAMSDRDIGTRGVSDPPGTLRGRPPKGWRRKPGGRSRPDSSCCRC